MAEPVDFLAIEQAIVARLKQRLPELRAVQTAEELAGVQQSAQHAPAAHVLFTGYTPRNTQRDDVIQVDQSWTVVLVTQTVQQHTDARRGQMMARIIAALHGWKPDQARTPMTLIGAPIPPSYGPGVAYLPVAFETSVITRTGD
ncbi:MAG: phage tail terminator protein [Halomonas sp.]